MSFGSGAFLVFLLIVVVVYYALPPRLRWVALLLASYAFYLSAGPRFLPLLLVVTLVTYAGGLFVRATGRKSILALALLLGVMPLLVFKYSAFVAGSVDALVGRLGMPVDVPGFSLLLPIGISFYTFKALSYLIDVYRDPSQAEPHLGRYALAISFFPQIFAGPIQRPARFLPQLRAERRFDRDQAAAGLRLMALGYLKKLVIADNLALIVGQVYGEPRAYVGLPLVVATLAFSVQIYCDFSGYSDIANGVAQVLGFPPVENFRRPYFSRSIQEFWRRWHITLSSWFRDYLYFPLGGSRVGRWRYYANLMVVFVVSGLWHGAGWTFAAWGALHGLYLVAGSATSRWRHRVRDVARFDRLPRVHAALAGVFIFGLVTLAWVFFRASSLPDALYVLSHVPSGLGSQLASPEAVRAAVAATGLTTRTVQVLALSIAAVLLLEGLQEVRRWAPLWRRIPGWQRLAFYYALAAWVVFVGSFGDNPFIYFRF